jgi:tetratricopeptide (TPR) repeat protein
MISGLPKELNELAVLYDADNSSVQAGSYLTWPSIDLLKGLAAGRQKLNSWLIGGTDRLAKLAMESGLAMFDRYTESGNADQLDRAIELYREALSLRRTGHPDRATSLFMLGCLLYMRYEQTGNVALLNEAIELKREALVLQPPGHPSRSNTCNLLGFSLHARFEHTGDAALLDEVIEVEREALALRPPGHPDRSTSCDNLAASLFVRYEQTGNVALLHEAIEVEREALALRPPGHRRRPGSCVHLATLLTMRSNRTGDITPLNEATELKREATKLGSSDHSSQPMTGATLTNSLYARYEQTGDVALLEKAIELEREGLGLRPPGHPHQAKISASLASSLSARFIQTGNVALLDKAIGFHREALVLQPPGHHDQASSCVGLVMLLSLRYKQTRDVALLDEAVAICSYTLKYSSASQVWYPLTQLSFIHLIRGSPHFSALEALVYLDRSFQHGVDNIPAFISQVCLIVRLIWDDSSTWAPHIRVTVLLVGVYAQLVDRLPLVAGFVLDTSSRLRTLKETHHIGSDACVAALLAEQPATAVELLDRAHGLVWTQALHQRDPQMEGAPKDLAIELEDLLRAIGTSVPVDPAGHLDHPQDVRHRQDTRIQIILREIRAIPGLARFMLGSTYDTLREAAREHPVVVLVAARDHAFALIMPSSLHAGPDILRLDVASHTLQSFANSVGPANMRYRACSPSCEDVHLADSAIGLGPDRKMGPGDHFTQRSPLVKLWLSVVKPVLTYLGLAVRPPWKRKAMRH